MSFKILLGIILISLTQAKSFSSVNEPKKHGHSQFAVQNCDGKQKKLILIFN